MEVKPIFHKTRTLSLFLHDYFMSSPLSSNNQFILPFTLSAHGLAFSFTKIFQVIGRKVPQPPNIPSTYLSKCFSSLCSSTLTLFTLKTDNSLLWELFYALEDVYQHPWSLPTRCTPPAVKTKSVSRHYQMSSEWQNHL